MGIFDKKKTETVIEPAAPVYRGTIIEEGITFVGDFTADEPIRILGSVEGKVKTSQNVFVAKSGYQRGSMDVVILDVDGTVDSDVLCRGTATFSVGSTFSGELTAVNFEASRGSNFKGKLNLIELEDVKKLEAEEKAAAEAAENKE